MVGRNNHRGGGRGREGRGGRGGRGRGNSSDAKPRNNAAKTPEYKFYPHGYGREKQTLSYDSVKDHIIQEVQKTMKNGKDIAETLRKGTMFNIDAKRPSRALSTKSNEDEKKADQVGLDMMYQAEIDTWVLRKAQFEDNLNKTYSLIMSKYCSKAIHERVEAHPEFDTKIIDNPIELLKAIKILMHDPVRARYPYASLTDALSRLMNCKQMDNESANDYMKRFKGNRDGVTQHMGKDFLKEFVKNTKEYKNATDEATKESLEKGSFAKWIAYLFLKNSDQNKYGSVVTGLTSQFSLGNDQYPKDIATACDILSNHRFDKTQKNRSGNKRDGKKDDDTASTLTTRSESSFAQGKAVKDMACFCCGKKGHTVPTCPEKATRKKEDWVVRKAMMHMQGESEKESEGKEEDDASRTSSKGTKGAPWAIGLLNVRKDCLHGKMWAAGVKENSIILDNGSTLSLFANPKMVENIRESGTTLELATNAGTIMTNKIADVPGYGTVWYNENAIANIFGLSDLKKKHRITYDSEKEDAFIVHMGQGKTTKFACSAEGLYHYVVKNENDKEMSNLISTIKENRAGYTQRQFERAKTARELYHIVGTPTVENFKNLLKMNAIRNCPVTSEDVTIAEKIFGPDMSSLKGKSTRRKPNPVKEDVIEIPKELITQHRDIDLCIDIMYVNECGFMTTIDRTIKFRSAIPITGRTHEEYYRALDVVLRLYNGAGFVIKTIHCDGEFRALMERVKDDLHVKMNFTNALDHVPEAERNNRTIKERIRAAFQRLPYKAIPRVMIRYLAMTQTQQLNLFPVKGGISPYYSPATLLGLPTLDYTKHCQVPYGAFVQANHETNQTSSNITRTLDAIYLRPATNMQGGHELMDLNSGHVITRARVTQIPVTDVIIRAVETMAHQQGFKDLKFKNRHKQVFHDADWIAGVDYANTADEDEEEDEAYTDNGTGDENDDDEMDDQLYDPIDENEIDELEEEVRQDVNHNPIVDEDEDDRSGNDNDQDDTALVSEQESESQASEPRRSGRASRPVERLEPRMSGQSYLQTNMKTNKTKCVKFREDKVKKLEYCHNLIVQTTNDSNNTIEYGYDEAMLMTRLISDITKGVMEHGASFAQQYMLEKGLKIFGPRGHDASKKEINQLHQRTCFAPLLVSEMTQSEKKKAQLALMFLTEKRDTSVKGRMVYNGKPTREWLSREDAASPTAALESIILTGVIDAKEGRDVMTCDIPNAFIQAHLPKRKPNEDRVVMKITGALVDMLVEINPELYGPAVVMEHGKKVLYVEVLRAIYGMLEAAILWYKKFRKDLEKIGFVFNPYDPCVANRNTKGSQQTLVFHVDDLKSTHKLKSVNDEFEKWLNEKYGKHGKVTTTRGRIHDYLGMELDYTKNGELHVGMTKYVKAMVNDFPIRIGEKDTAKTPAPDSLFNLGTGAKLDAKRAEIFHTFVAKGLFLCKRARPDIQQTISVLCTRVKDPNQADWMKLIRMMKYLNGTKELKLKLRADDLKVIKWFVDASFAVHPDFKSHTGAVMTFGKGAAQSIARKQKLNVRSSTEGELVGVDDAATQIMWTKLFLEAQGYDIEKNIIYQDNKSAILLETNGKKSAGKRSRALNIRYFFITDQVEKGNAQLQWCSTDDMVGDFFTKPLQGAKFRKFRDEILGQGTDI